MKIQEQRHGAVTVLRPDGPLAASESGEFRDRMLRAYRENFGRVVLDASKIPFVDSEGLEAMLDVNDVMASSGQSLHLCAINDTLRRVLELTGLSQSFEYFEDVNVAVRSFL